MYSASIDNLLKALKKLPSVGDRTAARYIFHWLNSGKKEVSELILALQNLKDNIKSCGTCWNFSDTNPCTICCDKRRDYSTICVVEQTQDLMAIEQTGSYRGLYHVLRSLLDPSDLDSVKYTKIRELLLRVKKEEVREILLALNPDIEGETTSLYLEKNLKKLRPELKITRLARGLPMGADLQYADEVTLSSAIKNRTGK